DFNKKGNRHLIEILEGEFEDIEIKMGINIAGKQKDLVNLSDKILSIFQFVFTNPQGFVQAMQIPGLSSAFNDILEFSGISPANFAALIQANPQQALMQQPQQPQQPQPQQPLVLNQPAPAQ